MGAVAPGLVRQPLALQASAGLRHWNEATLAPRGIRGRETPPGPDAGSVYTGLKPEVFSKLRDLLP
jgi:hypothetical protein